MMLLLCCWVFVLLSKLITCAAFQFQIESCRREWISLVVNSWLAPVQIAHAAETVGKDEDCNQSTCLGVWDGLLADCPHDSSGRALGAALVGAGCASSQDDTPGNFAEPWDFSESDTMDWSTQMKRLVPTIQLVSARYGDQVGVIMQTGRYLRVIFIDGRTREESIGEFYFTPDDTTVQFRLASTSGPAFSSRKNMERSEDIRKAMRFLKLPVLRNRSRTLVFGESSLDTFGPGSAALGPPAEMTTGELEGRQEIDSSLPTDLVQQFPLR